MTMSSSANSVSDQVRLHPIRTRPSSEEFRLCSRRLSHEFPIMDTSLDVYYKESSVGVPFLWESRPGTPKIKTAVYPLPPLTPPPSFHTSPISIKPLRKQSRNNLQILPKINLKRTQLDQSPSPLNESNWFRVSSPPRFGEDHHCESPVSTLCFGGTRRGARAARSPGCSASIIKLLLRELS